MADSPVFDFTADHLEQATTLDKLAARGTVRLALKGAGLEPATVSSRHMLVVLKSVLPGALRRRGVEEADAICLAIGEALANAGLHAGHDAADRAAEIFARLASDS